jgi:large subunit ribosomal protein L10
VVARGGGSAAITVTIGGKAARAHVYVQQKPVELSIIGDSLFRMPEGDRRRARAHLVDSRGHEIPSYAPKWRSADASIAAVDSSGNATGMAPGRTTFTATLDGMIAQLGVEVFPVPASLTLLSGDGQRAPAGRKVAQPVTVQVVSRSGRPIPGIPVRFALEEGAGRAEPQADSSDAQGIARASWTLGGFPGRQSLSVTAEGVASPTVVTAEAEPVAANTRVAQVSEHLKGPLALTFHPREPVALAKVLNDFAKDNPQLEFKAGLMDGKILGAKDLQALATLPSREVLIAQLLGQMTSPLASFQRVLLAPMRDLASVLDQIASKKQAG